MKTCANNHMLIEWHNSQAECPVCAITADLDRATSELMDLRASREAEADLEKRDLNCRKGFSHE